MHTFFIPSARLQPIQHVLLVAVIPLVGAVDTFWIGRMGDALSLAGQGAANQCFFSLFFLIAFLPTLTAPLVAKACGAGDNEAACARVCEASFLALAMSIPATLILALKPLWLLRLVLPPSAAAAPYAARYLSVRSLSLAPALLASIGFAAFRGTLDTLTPLKVSLASNLLNLILDPLLIFGLKLGVSGAALATIIAEFASGAIYMVLLLRRRLVRMRLLVKPPSARALLPLVQGGLALLVRQLALNVGFITATRSACAMDGTGVAAAAYAITQQIYSLGLVVMLAVQATGATLVPAALAGLGGGGGDDGERQNAARAIADRLTGWSTCIALTMAASQLLFLDRIIPLFSTLPEVCAAVRRPAIISAGVQALNSLIFPAEGVMLGTSCFGYLAGLTAVGCATMVGGITLSARMGAGLGAIWLWQGVFHLLQMTGAMTHYLWLGPLGKRNAIAAGVGAQAESIEAAECVVVPMGGQPAEVCADDSS